MTDIERLVRGISINRVFGDVEIELLQKILEDHDRRLSRIQKALGIDPLSDEDKKTRAQDDWFAGSEPWRDQLRRERELKR